MLLKISLKNFRNHLDTSQNISEEFIVVVGDNAKGKTSLIEGIFTGATGAGFRNSDGLLINKNQDSASVRLETVIGSRQVKLLGNDGEKLEKLFSIDNEPVRGSTKFSKGLPIVLFDPEELRMLTGPPDLRRAWLDDLLSKISPNYPMLIKNYSRALKQRNRLLKTGVTTEDQYFVWELKLSEYGSLIVESRKKLFSELNKLMGNLYRKISAGEEEVSVVYQTPDGPYASWLANILRLKREHDQRIGYTTCGPHRDDFSVIRDGKPLNETGSRGEVRSAVLALKLFEVFELEKFTNVKPVLLLDDVFSELDHGRRRALLTAINGYQTFITTTDLDQDFIEAYSPQIIQL